MQLIDRRAAHIHRAQPTTFQELGIELPVDPLGLAQDQVDVVRFNRWNGPGTAYLATVHRPLAGDHANLVAAFLAPFKNAGKFAAQADFRMPQEAMDNPVNANGKETNDARLDRIHSTDPDLGPIYLDFKANNWEAWRRAFSHSGTDSAFKPLYDLVVTPDLSSFILAAAIGTNPLSTRYSEDETSINLLTSVASSQGFQTRLLKAMERNGVKQNRKPYKNFRKRDFDTRVEILDDFYSRLLAREQLGFIERYAEYDRRVIVGVADRGKFIRDRRGGGPSPIRNFRFQSDSTIEVDVNGTHLELAVRPDQVLGWKMSNYQFGQEYLDDALSPTIAWYRANADDRGFLNQVQAQELLAQIDTGDLVHPDVYLGRVYPAVFSPDKTRHWKRSLDLKEGKYSQAMMSAQMAAWPSYPKNAESLFAPDNPFFATLEDHTLGQKGIARRVIDTLRRGLLALY